MIIEGKFNEILGWLHAYVAEKYPSNANTVSNMYKALQTAPDDNVRHYEIVPDDEPEVIEVEVEDDGEPDEEEVEDQDQTE